MAIWGLVILIAMVLISASAYFYIEDTSPHADQQLHDIALKEPGFETDFVLLKSFQKNVDPGLLGYFIGRDYAYRMYPIKEAAVGKDAITVTTHFNTQKVIKKEELFHPEDLSANISHKRFLLGTDRYGRSIMSRLILGIRISLVVGLFAVLISITVGILMGLIGGYFGGWVDRVVMYFVNVMWSIPTLLLVFAIVLAMGRGLWIIILAIGLTMWVDVARIVRGQVKKIKEEQYVMAAKSLGVKVGSVLFQHILPNIIGPILVIAAANFATAILIEAGLSYLGFGVKPPTPSLGNMLNEHYGYAISGKPILAIIPAVTIMILVLSINLLGSGLRDVYDVKSVD